MRALLPTFPHEWRRLQRQGWVRSLRLWLPLGSFLALAYTVGMAYLTARIIGPGTPGLPGISASFQFVLIAWLGGLCGDATTVFALMGGLIGGGSWALSAMHEERRRGSLALLHVSGVGVAGGLLSRVVAVVGLAALAWLGSLPVLLLSAQLLPLPIWPAFWRLAALLPGLLCGLGLGLLVGLLPRWGQFVVGLPVGIGVMLGFPLLGEYLDSSGPPGEVAVAVAGAFAGAALLAAWAWLAPRAISGEVSGCLVSLVRWLFGPADPNDSLVRVVAATRQWFVPQQRALVHCVGPPLRWLNTQQRQVLVATWGVIGVVSVLPWAGCAVGADPMYGMVIAGTAAYILGLALLTLGSYRGGSILQTEAKQGTLPLLYLTDDDSRELTDGKFWQWRRWQAPLAAGLLLSLPLVATADHSAPDPVLRPVAALGGLALLAAAVLAVAAVLWARWRPAWQLLGLVVGSGAALAGLWRALFPHPHGPEFFLLAGVFVLILPVGGAGAEFGRVARGRRKTAWPLVPLLVFGLLLWWAAIARVWAVDALVVTLALASAVWPWRRAGTQLREWLVAPPEGLFPTKDASGGPGS